MSDTTRKAMTFTVEVELTDEPMMLQMDRWLLAFNSAREQRQCRVNVTEPYPSPFAPDGNCWLLTSEPEPAVPSYPGQLEELAAEMDRPKPRQVPPHTVGGPTSGFGA